MRGRVAKAVAALADGTRTAGQIARALSAVPGSGPVSTRAVWQTARRHGLPLRPEADVRAARLAEVQRGVPVAQVAAAAGVRPDAIYGLLQRHGQRAPGRVCGVRVSVTLPPDLHAWLAEDCPEGRSLGKFIVGCLQGVRASQEQKSGGR